MTCKERYMQEHPDKSISEVIKYFCPCEFYDIDDPEDCTGGVALDNLEECKSCWNREIPENKKEKNIMTCREKLITEHPEWSEVIIMKCTDIFTPNEYFTLDGPELLWSDIYPGKVEECSEDEDGKEKRELLDMIKDYEDRLKYANAEIDNLDGKIAGYKYEVKELIAKLDDANKCALDVMNELHEKEEELAKLKEEFECLDAESDRQDKEIEELRNKLAERAQTIEKLRDDTLEANWRVCSDENKILRVEKATQAESIKDLLATVKAKEKQISELCARINKLDEERYIEQDIAVTREITEKTKPIKENDELFNALDTKSEYAKSLNSMLNDRIEKYQTLKANIEMMGFEVGNDNTVIVRPDKPHFAIREEVADKFNSCSSDCALIPTDIARAIAMVMRTKYDALTYVGFSHDDAMALIPMWGDKEN